MRELCRPRARRPAGLCAAAAAALAGRGPHEAAARSFFETYFEPRPLGPGLVTGYYEPELRGARAPGGPFTVPLLAMPPAPPPGERLPDRAEIEAGALDGQGLEMLWVDDPVDAFFLQIQGSGRVRLPDGRMVRVGYAGQNGHPFRGISRSLAEVTGTSGTGLSMQALRAGLAAIGPAAAASVMQDNPSWVFFREVPGLRPEAGPVGAMGVSLTPLRSIAVDPTTVPLGSPVFSMRRLLVAQDTGGAIRGEARADLFHGWGDAAGERAGVQYERAEMWVLVPRGAALPAAAPLAAALLPPAPAAGRLPPAPAGRFPPTGLAGVPPAGLQGLAPAVPALTGSFPSLRPFLRPGARPGRPVAERGADPSSASAPGRVALESPDGNPAARGAVRNLPR